MYFINSEDAVKTRHIPKRAADCVSPHNDVPQEDLNRPVSVLRVFA
jgi:hypothetical protein